MYEIATNPKNLNLKVKKLLKDYPEKQFVIFLNSFKSRGVQERLAWLRKYKNIQIKHH